MLLVKGFKAKEVAAQMGISPAAVSQRYKILMNKYIIPNFKMNFDMEPEMPIKLSIQPTTEIRFNEEIIGEDRISDYSFDDTFEDWEESIIVEKRRTTPDFITTLAPGEIFVFGSNLRGIHGGGAAYMAYKNFGAIMGKGTGLQGQSYAIPTMQGDVSKIKPYVDEFIEFAQDNPNLTFLVTKIGCGMAGFFDFQIFPLFQEAHSIKNIILPERW